MEELYVNINELVQDLLIPARVEKKINKEAFEIGLPQSHWP